MEIGKIIDARGQICPKPLILTKKGLTEAAPGETVRILIDNPTSKQNVERFLKDNGYPVAMEEEDGLFTLIVTAGGTPLARPEAEAYCSPAAVRPHVVFIVSDRIGDGPEDLGRLLLKGVLAAVLETSPLPGKIIFMNNGVLLAVEGSQVLDTLRDLERKGVGILSCGTCLDYFGRKAEVRVGSVSNACDIVRALTDAGHVIAL